MTGAKELAGMLRHMADHLPLNDVEIAILRESAAHLDRLAAIDSAVPGEVGEIQRAHAIAEASPRCQDLRTPEETAYSAAFAVAHKNRATLLAIVQCQAGEMEALTKYAAVVEVGRDAARSEVAHLTERLRMMQHGEAESLKMMGSEKQRADFELHNATVAQSAIIELEADVRDLRTETGATILRLRGEATEQRVLAEALARGIAAYRVGGYTAAQVWENGEGKTVTR